MPRPTHSADGALPPSEVPLPGVVDDADARVHPLLRLAGVIGFAMLTGLGAHVAIPLPPDGVPMTLQTLAVVLAALGLGPKLGTAAMLLYLGAGTLGAAIFAGGEAGAVAILGQTGGYLVGFVLCQPVICWIIRKPDGGVRGWGAMIVAVLAGHAVIFAIGVPWLAVVRGFTLMRAVEGGFVPFIPGLILKSAIAVMIGRIAAPWASRRIW